MLVFIEEWLLLWTMAYHYAGQCDKGRTICCQSHDIATINTQYLTCDKNIHQYEEIFTLSHTTFDMWQKHSSIWGNIHTQSHDFWHVTKQYAVSHTTSPLHRHYIATTSPLHRNDIATTSQQHRNDIQTCHACSFNIYQSYNITIERN